MEAMMLTSGINNAITSDCRVGNVFVHFNLNE